MGLETGTYISDFVDTNPAASDNMSQGDDHIRWVKSAVLATFPSITGAVTATHTQLNTVKQFSYPAVAADIASDAVTTAKILDANVTTAKIADDAVTYAKMQNVSATDRLLGRDTAGAGNTEELTVSGGIEFTGSGGIQTGAFTGDVTKAAGGTALTIAADAVTLAQMQNISTGKLLGRSTAGSGDPEQITASTGLTLSGGALTVTNPSVRVKLSAQTASASAALDFTSGIDSTYRAYVFELDNVLPATDGATLKVEVSVDGGSNWLTANYKAVTTVTAAGGSPGGGQSTSSIEITSGSIENTSGYGVGGFVRLHTPSNSSTKKMVTFQTSWYGTDANIRSCTGSGFYNGANTAINAVRFIMDSGNITSGTITMYGITG